MENKYKSAGRTSEHRQIAENRIGRFLEAGEVVHHINGIKADNRPKNLMVFASRSFHMFFHRQGYCEEKGIVFDGRKKMLKATIRKNKSKLTMKLKQPKLMRRKGVNISRACWEMVIEEHKRTDKDYQLIVELAIKKMLGKK